jgi:hypothetical protein
VRPECKDDNSAVLIVPNVKVRVEVQQYIPHLVLHILSWEIIIFTYSLVRLKILIL